MKWESMRWIVGGTTIAIALGLGTITTSQAEERSTSAQVESGAPAGEGDVQPRGLPLPQIPLSPLKQLPSSEPNFPVRLVESLGHRGSPPFFGSNPVVWNAMRKGYVVTVNFPVSLRLTFRSTGSSIYPAQAYTGIAGNRYVAEVNNDNLQYFLILPGNSFASQVISAGTGLTIVHLGAPGAFNDLTITVAKRNEPGAGVLTPLYSFPVFFDQP
jgi:hypothetical protein